MMKVVRFWRWEEREMIARVRVQRRQQGHREPQPSGGDVRAANEYAQKRRQNVAENVF